jgi:ketosteroid isomerase-like protein
VSQQNLDFVRNVFGGVESMDRDALLGALPELIRQLADPAIEWIEDPTRADSRTYRGHDGVLASWRRWLEQWEDYGWEAERFVDCGDDVFVAARETGSGSSSGATVSSSIFIVITIREEKVLRWREYYNEASALQAVGLAE